MKLKKNEFLLFIIFLPNISWSQPVIQLNKNVKVTVKVITIKSKHFIIPNLKVLSDTQDIQVPKQITYGSENIPIADCRFSLGKVIKNKLVNMYVNRLYDPFLGNELRKFTTKDSLTDTICVEDFIPLEYGQYVVSLEFSYYRNGVKDILHSNEAVFFVRPPRTHR